MFLKQYSYNISSLEKCHYVIHRSIILEDVLKSLYTRDPGIRLYLLKTISSDILTVGALQVTKKKIYIYKAHRQN